MTSPLYETPPNAYTGSTVASMQNVTQADIGQRQGAEISAMLDDVGFSFIDIILGGFGNVIGAIGAAINKFISDLLIGLRNATGGLVDLTGFLKQTDVKATQASVDAVEAKDKATAADVAAGNAAIVAGNADSKAVQANNAAAAAAALAATKAGKQDFTNLAYVYNSEDPAMRTMFPSTHPVFAYGNTAGLAVSGTWYLSITPANPSSGNYPVMRVGEDFYVTPGEKIYMEWRQRREDANFNARLNLTAFQQDGSVASGGYDNAPVQPTSSAVNNTWITYAGIVTVPAGVARMRPEAKLQIAAGVATTGRWLFEEMVIRRAVTSTQVTTADGTALDTKLVTLTDNNNVTNQLAVQAANNAQEALLTADIAYENAQYWKDECVVASAGVVLGVNELVIGVVMDVPTGRSRKITDMHFAFLRKPVAFTVETKIQSADGVGERVARTDTVPATQTRWNINNLNIDVADKERVFWNVTSTATTTVDLASVFQVALVGVLL